MPTRKSHPATVAREVLHETPVWRQVGLFVVGALMVLASLGVALLEVTHGHAPTVLRVVLHVVFVIGGLALMAPDRTLALLEKIPLPAFLHRT